VFDALLANELMFKSPVWLWGLLLPLVIVVLQRLLRRRQKQSYADDALWPWVAAEPMSDNRLNNQMTRPGGLFVVARLMGLFTAGRFLVLAWLCLIIAIAGPRSLDQAIEIESRSGVDVMIGIDVSRSMTAQDVLPSRFQLSKTLAESLINHLKNSDRVALGVFAGQPHAVVPLTHDKNIVQQSLNIIQPAMLPTKGSWLELALIGKLNVLKQTGRAAKVLVVFTDGAPAFWKPVPLPKVVEDLSVAKSQKRQDTGVKVVYVGVGLPRSANLPDATDDSGKYRVNGLLVQSRLEESQLKRLAQQTEGVYLRAEPGPDFIQKLIDEVVQTSTITPQEKTRQIWHDYAYPFIVAGLVSLLFAFYLTKGLAGFTQRLTRVFKGKVSTLSTGLLLPYFAVIFGLQSLPSDAVAQQTPPIIQQAFEAFNDDSFELAETLYDESSTYQGWFGAGAAAYRLGEMESAVLYFRQAAWQAPNEKERAKALYNLGNSFYVANLLPQAVESFEQALLYQSPYPNAEHNLALAKQRYELEQQGKLNPEEQEGKGEGKGSQGKDSEGAFYGGQKVGDSDKSEQGFGSDGDADEGSRQGKKIKIPDVDSLTDYRLNPSIAKLKLNSIEQNNVTHKVLQAQRSQQRAEQFEHELQQLNDDQLMLLKRLFEREEGFHAEQKEAHAIPGVQPW